MVRGRVQGVFFRDTLRRLAGSRNVAGWARNTPEGTVEAVFEGEREGVESMIRFVHEGPRGAAVEQVEIVEEQPEQLTGFQIR